MRKFNPSESAENTLSGAAGFAGFLGWVSVIAAAVLAAFKFFLAGASSFPFSLLSAGLFAAGAGFFFLSRTFSLYLRDFYRIREAALAAENGKIEDIAHSLEENPKDLIKKLRRLLRLGLFDYAYLDKMEEHLVIGCISDLNELKTLPVTASDRPLLVTVKCPGCGAVNSAEVGQIGECVYCGRPLDEHITR